MRVLMALQLLVSSTLVGVASSSPNAKANMEVAISASGNPLPSPKSWARGRQGLIEHAEGNRVVGAERKTIHGILVGKWPQDGAEDMQYRWMVVTKSKGTDHFDDLCRNAVVQSCILKHRGSLLNSWVVIKVTKYQLQHYLGLTSVHSKVDYVEQDAYVDAVHGVDEED